MDVERNHKEGYWSRNPCVGFHPKNLRCRLGAGEWIFLLGDTYTGPLGRESHV